MASAPDPPTLIQSITLQQSGGAPTNRITSVTSGSTVNYVYDAAGNVTNDGVHAYEYDAENRIVKVDDGATAEYRYDHQNRRVTKVVGSSWTHYVWEEAQVIGEHDATTPLPGYGEPPYQEQSARLDYVYADAKMIRSRQRASSTGPWTTRYFLSDRLSVRMTLDSSGSVAGRQAHLPFGEDFGESGAQEKHHLTSYERDVETGTDYAINRGYSVGIGRFLQSDPYRASGYMVDPQSWNRYRYSRNDPVNKIDPLGLLERGRGGEPNPDADAQDGDFFTYLQPLLDLYNPQPPRRTPPQSPLRPRVLPERMQRLVQAAVTALQNYLSGGISEDCAKNVVGKLAANLSGSFDLSAFKVYLARGVQFFDGTRSNIPVAGNIMPRQPADLLYGAGATIAGVFGSHPGINAMTSILTSNLTVFLRPGNDANGNPVIDGSDGGDNPRNLSLLFHEALHGFTGKVDEDLQRALDLPEGASGNITDYIREHCF